jgi:hypothetical protein
VGLIGAVSVREKQGLVPDLQIDSPHNDLTTSSGVFVPTAPAPTPSTNYKRGLSSTGYSTGVAKKELNIAKLMAEKAARLERDAFGVDGGHGPWQQRLARRDRGRQAAAGLWSVRGDDAWSRSAPH